MLNYLFLPFVILILNFQVQIFSQTFQFNEQPDSNSIITLNYIYPSYEREVNISFFSGIYDLSANIPISNKFNIVGSIPFSTYSTKGSNNESGIGNIYLGLQTKNKLINSEGSYLSFGVFFPTAKDYINYISFFSNFYYIQKFIPNTLSLYSSLTFLLKYNSGIKLNFNFGPDILISTKENYGGTNLSLHYGINGSFTRYKFSIVTEFIGKLMLSNSAENFTDRFFNELLLGGNYNFGIINCGIYYKTFFNEYLERFIKGAWGIKIKYSI